MQRVAVFGQGYVGLSVAVAAAVAGHDEGGIDIAAHLSDAVDPHTSYDLDWVVKSAGLVFDARNATRGAPGVVIL